MNGIYMRLWLVCACRARTALDGVPWYAHSPRIEALAVDLRRAYAEALAQAIGFASVP